VSRPVRHERCSPADKYSLRICTRSGVTFPREIPPMPRHKQITTVMSLKPSLLPPSISTGTQRRYAPTPWILRLRTGTNTNPQAWFYDFNTTSGNRTDIFGPHGTFALWQNITPPELLGNETLGLQMASGWRYLLGHYAGIPSPATLIEAGLNWDFPNAWPPHACEFGPTLQRLEL
jgi:hypothetical protein